MQLKFIALSAFRQIDLPAIVCGVQLIPQLMNGILAAMNQKDMAGREAFQQCGYLGLVTVSGKPYLFDAASHRQSDAVHIEGGRGAGRLLRALGFAVYQIQKLPSRRLLVLIAGEDDACILRRNQVLGILDAGASGEHAGAGDKDHRIIPCQKLLPFLACGDGLDMLCVEGLVSLQDSFS